MFKLLIIGAGLILVVSSCSSKTSTSISISELHQKSAGTYLIHGRCMKMNKEIIISDNTGSIKANGDVNCYGNYGQGRVTRQGTNTLITKFNSITQVNGKYRIKKFISKTKVVIDKDGQEMTVSIKNEGFSQYVIHTSNGFIRI